MPALILASASPRRQELVRTLSLPYWLYPVDVDETVSGCAKNRVTELALRKAGKAASMLAAAREKECLALQKLKEQADGPLYILGADTLVCFHDEVFGKPKDSSDAYRMLSCLQGNWHQVMTGLCLWDLDTGQYVTHCEISQVHFAPMTENDIRSYIATGDPIGKAGSYGIQSGAGCYIDRIEGCYFNIMGLPLYALRHLIQTFSNRVVSQM